MAKRGLEITLVQAQAHADRHGYSLEVAGNDKTGPGQSKRAGEVPAKLEIHKKDRMTRPEREMALILETRKRAGEILAYRFEGISLAWGADPKTGKPMRYKPDFLVVRAPTLEDSENLHERHPTTLIECKGGRIWPQDFIRFKGCRAEWPIYQFELWQRDRNGGWTRLE